MAKVATSLKDFLNELNDMQEYSDDSIRIKKVISDLVGDFRVSCQTK